MAANTSITQTSGAISFSEIKAAYTNTSTDNSISSYRNANKFEPGQTTSGSNTPSGTISFSDFYNSVDSQEVVLNDGQTDIISSQYPRGGCAGAGVQGVNVRVSSGNISVFAGGWMADYNFFGNTSFNTTYGGTTHTSYGPSGNKIWVAGESHSTTSGSTVIFGGFRRDTSTVHLDLNWNGDTLTGNLIFNCKGGTYPASGFTYVSLYNDTIGTVTVRDRTS
jgi:hypothetical protein|tara:strand:+ start:495 stop:1160 length:666 start_codon:yes stop_codon:yes gene_type:complete